MVEWLCLFEYDLSFGYSSMMLMLNSAAFHRASFAFVFTTSPPAFKGSTCLHWSCPWRPVNTGMKMNVGGKEIRCPFILVPDKFAENWGYCFNFAEFVNDSVVNVGSDAGNVVICVEVLSVSSAELRLKCLGTLWRFQSGIVTIQKPVTPGECACKEIELLLASNSLHVMP